MKILLLAGVVFILYIFKIFIQSSPPKLNTYPKPKIQPCEFDHNGECLICDCWIEDCAYNRYLNKDYKYETEEQLKQMFETHKK
jgi:hypothetical protein